MEHNKSGQNSYIANLVGGEKKKKNTLTATGEIVEKW